MLIANRKIIYTKNCIIFYHINVNIEICIKIVYESQLYNNLFICIKVFFFLKAFSLSFFFNIWPYYNKPINEIQFSIKKT